MNDNERDIRQIVGLQPKVQPDKRTSEFTETNLESSQTDIIKHSCSLERNSYSPQPLVSKYPALVHSSPPLVSSSPPLVSSNLPLVSLSPPSVTDSQPVLPCSPPSVSGSQPVVPSYLPLVSGSPPSVPSSPSSVSDSQPVVPSNLPLVSLSPPSVPNSHPLVSDSQPSVSDSQQVVSSNLPLVSSNLPLLVPRSPPSISSSPPLVSDSIPVNSDSQRLIPRSPPLVSDIIPEVSDSEPLISSSPPSVSESLPLVSDSKPSVSSSLPLAENNISTNGYDTKTLNSSHKVFYSSLVEALNTNKNDLPDSNEDFINDDLLSEGEMTTKPTNSKSATKSKKIARTQRSNKLSQMEIPKPISNSEKLISEIIASCDRHVFGQTSSIQIILNICSQIMPIEGCEKPGNDIMDVCSQILSDAYRNSQNVIDLCKRLSKWQAKLEMKQEATSKGKGSKKKTLKKNGNIDKSKPLVKVKEEKLIDVQLDELPLISDSEDELNQVDDPDWTSYWAKKNNTVKAEVHGDLTDCDQGLKRKRKISEDDVDWVPEHNKEKESKPSKKKKKPTQKRPPPIRGEFKCYQCPRVLPTLRGFQNHLECHKKVTCELCNLVCTKPHMKRHMMIHSGEKPFICDVCGSGFADVSSMKDHQHIHSDIKSIQCELCDYRCKSNKRLRMHMVRHTTERRFQCDNCGARFLRNSDLKKHLLVHKDNFPFACESCPKRFKDKGHLKRHEETHTDQYKFQCPFCGKRMRQSGNLKTHMRTHNGEKPYKCEKCGQGFAHNVTKKQHQEQCRRVIGVEVLIP